HPGPQPLNSRPALAAAMKSDRKANLPDTRRLSLVTAKPASPMNDGAAPTMQPFTKSRRRTARLALGIAFLGLSAVATAQPANTPAQSQAAQVQQPQTRDFAPDEKLFTFKGKTFTAGEWEDIIKYNPPSPM